MKTYAYAGSSDVAGVVLWTPGALIASEPLIDDSHHLETFVDSTLVDYDYDYGVYPLDYHAYHDADDNHVPDVPYDLVAYHPSYLLPLYLVVSFVSLFVADCKTTLGQLLSLAAGNRPMLLFLEPTVLVVYENVFRGHL